MHWQNNDHLALFPSHDSAPFIVPLPSMSLLKVEGEDAASFLHNLFTNDVKTLATNETRLCGFCTPKGRLLSLLTVCKQIDHFLLMLPSDLAAFIQQRLTLFILRSKVTISTLDNNKSLFTIFNSNESILTTLKQNTDSHFFTAPSMQNTQFGIVDSDKTAQINEIATQAGYPLLSENAWHLQLIKYGIAEVVECSKEAFTPQQINLDLVDGISFKKGCYPGQEVVARLHYLGSPSRRLCHARYQTDQLPQANTEVKNTSGEVLGHVVQAAWMEQGIASLQLSMKLSLLDQTPFLNEQPIDDINLYVHEGVETNQD